MAKFKPGDRVCVPLGAKELERGIILGPGATGWDWQVHVVSALHIETYDPKIGLGYDESEIEMDLSWFEDYLEFDMEA